jgi:hypothetical protein
MPRIWFGGRNDLKRSLIFVQTVREQNNSAALKKQHAQDVKIKKDRKAAQKNAGGKLGARKKSGFGIYFDG